ncbi:hypothetical protein TNCV_4361131 [Trichonephila clavipes]|nr:hypothetical protein TNCV_4361131 [Trichonephila clavipes]
MTLIDDIETRMPLRRNRRQYEQLTDFDRGRIIGLREAGWSNRRITSVGDMVVARCWQQWITEGNRRGGSIGTQMIARIVHSELRHQVIDSTPLTSFRHPIKRNHKETTTEVGRNVRLDFCRPRAKQTGYLQ